MGLLAYYFQPSGRIGRGGFWLGMLGLFVIEFAFTLWIAMTLFGHDVLDANAQPLAKPAMQLQLLIDLIFLFPLFVVLAKRFHDRNKGAAWALPFILAHVAVVIAAITGVLPTSMPAAGAAIPLPGLVIALAWIVIFAWTVIELGILRGTSGANRYGADPLAR